MTTSRETHESTARTNSKRNENETANKDNEDVPTVGGEVAEIGRDVLVEKLLVARDRCALVAIGAQRDEAVQSLGKERIYGRARRRLEAREFTARLDVEALRYKSDVKNKKKRTRSVNNDK